MLLAKSLTLLIMFPITNLESNFIDLTPSLQITKKLLESKNIQEGYFHPW